MLLKICGIGDGDQMRKLDQMFSPDYVGMIFYSKSPRFVQKENFGPIPATKAKKMGVFVNESNQYIMNAVNDFGLDGVQLHGNETIEQVMELKSEGLEVFKVFRVENTLPLTEARAFSQVADFILFDTMGKEYGGTGKSFSWNVLEELEGEDSVNWLLSGGIDSENVKTIPKEIKGFSGIDINSRVESQPGIKDFEKIKELLNNI